MPALDDSSLLRAIRLAEGEPLPGLCKDFDCALRELYVDKEAFQPIKDNDHLRGLLKTFLELNLQVERFKLKIKVNQEMGWIERYRRSGERKNLQLELTKLEALRDEAFKPYEMLRKLSDPDNILLKRYPS